MKLTVFSALIMLVVGRIVAGETAETPVVAPSAEALAAHALNRLGYGPRPGEIDTVARLGVENWIRAQLSPATIADPAAEAAVAGLTKLRLSESELVEAYQTEIRERTRMKGAEASGDTAKAEEMQTRMEGRERLVVAQALGELQYAKLARAVLSERQLEQVLVDFWFNHFNVDARKQQVRATVVSYEQDVIRPHVFGKFRDLLGATAQSSAMLVYLDNYRSARAMELDAEESRRLARMREATVGLTSPDTSDTTTAPERRGLNENYGRELLELHTLGVRGGYSQRDVQEVARAFTGWSINANTGQFTFRGQWHDDDAKQILDLSLPTGGGRRDGERVLDLLAAHPATALNIATKLCRRFVADEPPAALVERVAAAFSDSGGDLRATYEALFLDPAFFDPAHLATKTKSPFEFVASALRASGAVLDEGAGRRGPRSLRAVEAGALLGVGTERIAQMPRKTVGLHLIELGQAPYAWGPPTGYPEDSRHWVSAGALVARLNFALALTGGEVNGATVNTRQLTPPGLDDQAEKRISTLARTVLGRDPSSKTLEVLLRQVASGGENESVSPPDTPKLLALLLGSPEFQRR